MKTRRVALRIFAALERHHPNADTELHYRNPFELLVATILSAQSTDERVNLVTPALFERFPDARALASADATDLESLIHSTGFFRQKSKSLIGMAQAVVDHHHGQVPADMEALVKLSGVGRKTANVVLGHALGVPGLPVDRHVLRVSNRLGLVHGEDPERVEEALCALLPPERWTRASDTLILHGRRICRPTPQCHVCNARPDCDFFLRTDGVLGKAPAQAGGRKRPLRARASASAKATADKSVRASVKPGRVK